MADDASFLPRAYRSLERAIELTREVCVLSQAADGERVCGAQRAALSAKKFRIAVCALMKSGKSTLLCSLVRALLFPEDVLPATATVCDTTHHPDARSLPRLRMNGGPPVEGAEAIYALIVAQNTAARGDGTPAPRLELTTHVPALGTQPLEFDFVFADTPGYNEAGSHVIQDITERQLEEADVILYVFDITKLSSTDEERYLMQVANRRPDLVEGGRLVFAINKMDASEDREGDLVRAREVITRGLQRIKPSWTAETLFPISTQEFLFSFEVLSGRVADVHRAAVERMLFGELGGDIAGAEAREIAGEILDGSGFLTLETTLCERLTRTAPQLFVESMRGHLASVVETVVIPLLATRAACLTGTVDDRRQLLAALNRAIGGCESIARESSDALNGKLATMQAEFAALVRGLQSELPQAISSELARLQTQQFNTSEAAAEYARLAAQAAENRLAGSIALQGELFGGFLRQRTTDAFATTCTAARESAMHAMREALHDTCGALVDDLAGTLVAPPRNLPLGNVAAFAAEFSASTLAASVAACQSTTQVDVQTTRDRFVPAVTREETRTEVDDNTSFWDFVPVINWFTSSREKTVRTITNVVIVEQAKIVKDEVTVQENRFVVSIDALAESLRAYCSTVVEGMTSHYNAQCRAVSDSTLAALTAMLTTPIRRVCQQIARHLEEATRTTREIAAEHEQVTAALASARQLCDALRLPNADFVQRFSGDAN